MARVTQAEVLAIIEVSSAVTDLTPFIDMASVMVDSRIGTALSESVLKEIERWLAAHFVSVRDPRVKSESIGGISATYQGNTGMGLTASVYGQQAILLDTTGKLSREKLKGCSIGVAEYSTASS